MNVRCSKAFHLLSKIIFALRLSHFDVTLFWGKKVRKLVRKNQFSGVPTPFFRGSTPRRSGSGGPPPGNFFHLRCLNSLKFKSQASRFMPTVEYANKTKANVDGSAPTQIDHGSYGKGATTGCYTGSMPQADKLLRSRSSSHIDSCPSTTKIQGPGLNAGYTCPRLHVDWMQPIVPPSPPPQKGSSSFLLFPFLLSVLQLLLLSVLFVYLLPFWFCVFVRKFISYTQSKSLRVTMAREQPTLWPASQASRPIVRDVNASRNFDDFHGAISCRIIVNKLSSFS